MGRRGPVAKSPELKMVQGNPGKRPIKKSVTPEAGKVEIPDWLNEDARAEWKRLAPEMERLKLLTPLDAHAFAMYCDSYARWASCEKFLNENGLFYVSAAGKLLERPQVRIAQGYGQAARAFGSEFGLTPNSRARFTLPALEEEEDDEFERWLRSAKR
jgi:P27 family predicted phage terminase small subunit